MTTPESDELHAEEKAALRSWVLEEDLAVDLYLSGVQSGVVSAFANFARNVSPEIAKAAAERMVQGLQRDPLAVLQLREQLADWLCGDYIGEGAAISFRAPGAEQ